MENIYYSPEKFGLTVVDVVEESLSYEFNMVVVWKDEDGNGYWGQDSGCSCPTPFENYRSVDELEVLNRHTIGNLKNAVGGLSVSVAEKNQFFRQVEKELGRL